MPKPTGVSNNEGQPQQVIDNAQGTLPRFEDLNEDEANGLAYALHVIQLAAQPGPVSDDNGGGEIENIRRDIHAPRMTGTEFGRFLREKADEFASSKEAREIDERIRGIEFRSLTIDGLHDMLKEFLSIGFGIYHYITLFYAVGRSLHSAYEQNGRDYPTLCRGILISFFQMIRKEWPNFFAKFCRVMESNEEARRLTYQVVTTVSLTAGAAIGGAIGGAIGTYVILMLAGKLAK